MRIPGKSSPGLLSKCRSLQLCRHTLLLPRELPGFGFQRPQLILYSHQPLSGPSGLGWRTLLLLHDFEALELQPCPVDDLVGADGNQEGFEDWSAAVSVEFALHVVSECKNVEMKRKCLHEGCALVLVSVVGMWTVHGVALVAFAARSWRVYA